MENLKKAIAEAQLVLVGIGNEFSQHVHEINEDPLYHSLVSQIMSEISDEQERENYLQYIKYHYLKNNPDERIIQAYNQLKDLLGDKNYFVVSICTDDLIYQSELNKDRIVTPCGGYRALQCGKECAKVRDPLITDPAVFEEFMESFAICEGRFSKIDFPVCPECGKILWFNQVGAPEYHEEGYLDQWNLYTKWLQGTMNKKICILELGVGLQYPQIIRFPFEKIAFYNQKASFFRIHSKLYQMTEELKERGVSIKEKPVDFLLKG